MVPSDISSCRYVRTSGDTGVLDERQPFLEALAVLPEEDSYGDLPSCSILLSTAPSLTAPASMAPAPMVQVSTPG